MIDALYTTTDAHLSAFLVNEGARFVGLDRLSSKRVLFSFIADRELHVLLRRYWSGDPIPLVPSRLLGTLFSLRCLSIRRP